MAIENLPKDPMMLLSFVNTRLRDEASIWTAFVYNSGLQEKISSKNLRLWIINMMIN